MTIKVGDRLPEGRLTETVEFDAQGCPVNPKDLNVQELVKGKKIVIFGLPGAFTPTCSAKHVPSYVANFDALKKKGVDEIWCISVNDAFVMAAWMRDQKAGGKVRMMADGSAEYTKKLGLELDLDRAQHGRALDALLDARRRRRGEDSSTSRRPASSRSPAPRRC